MSKKQKKHTTEDAYAKLKSNIIKVLTANPNKSYNFKQLSRALGVNNTSDRNHVRDCLRNLAIDKILFEIKTGKYKLNLKSVSPTSKTQKTKPFISGAYITGTVDMKRTGKAYVIPDDKSGDIKIDPNNTGKALHRDKVKVILFPQRRDKKLEGQIVEIISRAKTSFVGIVNVSPNFAFLISDNPSMQTDIYIPLSNLNGARNGDKAIAEMTDWRRIQKTLLEK